MFSISTMLAQFPLLQSMTEGAPSRRMVVKGLLAVIAAGVPATGVELDAVARRRRRRRRKKKGKGGSEQKPLTCSGDSCDGTGGKPCGGRDDCQCYLAANGGNVCASSLQSSLEDTCDTNKDCPRGHVCVEGGPACGGRGIRFCKKACYK
jgi:hypothetical protein